MQYDPMIQRHSCDTCRKLYERSVIRCGACDYSVNDEDDRMGFPRCRRREKLKSFAVVIMLERAYSIIMPRPLFVG